jgi:hypothetical protein
MTSGRADEPEAAGRRARPAGRQSGSAGADAESGVGCYVCMDDDDGTNGLGAPLRHICACTNSVIHASCLEKLLNSTKSRAKPTAERTRTLCAVCNAPYALPLERYVLSAVVLPWRVEHAVRSPAQGWAYVTRNVTYDVMTS